MTVVTSNHGALPADEEVLGIPVVRVDPLLTWLTSPVTPRLKKVLSAVDADVVHAHSPPPLSSYYAAKARRSNGHPLVVTYHCDLELPLPWGLMVTGLYRRTFEAATFSRASRVIVTSRTYAATSRALWATTPTVIPMAVDARRFNPRAEPGDLRARLQLGPGAVVLYVGRLVRHKGVEYLLEAARSIPGAHFLIVGDGPSRPSLEGYARRLGSSNVRFSGRVSQTDLPSLYALADLLVLPSISRLEAFGTVALEAMACGRAVVLSDIPGVREVITDGQEGLLFEPMNSEDLAAKVSLLLGDLQLRSEMGARARRKVEETFNMEKVAGKIEEVYREVVGDLPGHHRELPEAPKEVTSPP